MARKGIKEQLRLVQEEKDKLDEMDRSELKRFIVANEMREKIKIKKSWSDDEIREAIRGEIKPSDEEEEPEPEEPEEEEEEPAEEEGDKFDEMDRSELKKFIVKNNLKGEIKIMKSWSDDDIREKIREALKSETGEEEESSEEEGEEDSKVPSLAEIKEKLKKDK